MSSASSPLDSELLRDLMGGDLTLLRDIIKIFLEDLPATTEALETAVRREDPTAIFKVAHRIKGSLLNLAATPAASEARSLEVLGRDGKVSEAGAHLEALKGELSRLRLALAELSSEAMPFIPVETLLTGVP